MSDSSSGILVPPGQYPPFAVVTQTDHTAWIIIAAALGLCWVLLFTGIRLFIRPSVRHSVELDEYAIAAATVSSSSPWAGIFCHKSPSICLKIDQLTTDTRSLLSYSRPLYFLHVLKVWESRLSCYRIGLKTSYNE